LKGSSGAPPDITGLRLFEEDRPLATTSATSLQLKPLADRVVVKKLEAEEKTAGGIVLPDTAKEKPQQGEVLAVGLGRTDEKGNRIAVEVKKGDKVLFAKYSGTEVKIEGVEYLILAERDILAVIG
jgi:chaperonin GroES